jgi:CRISPR-associated endonuclease/helicase Cas3
VHIVELPEPPKQLADIRKGRTAARELLGEWRRQFPGVPFPLDDPKQMDQYYERSFYRRKDEMSFSVQATKVGRDTTLLELLGSNRTALAAARRSSQLPMRPVLLQSFRTAADEFELIAETKGFVVPYGPGGKEMLNALSASFDLDREWQLLRKAQQFTVSVYEAQFKKMIDKGFLYEAKRNSGVYCLRAQFYDQEYGLRTEAGLMEDLSV